VCYWLPCSTGDANIYLATNAKSFLDIKVGQNTVQPSVKNSYRLALCLHSTNTTDKQSKVRVLKKFLRLVLMTCTTLGSSENIQRDVTQNTQTTPAPVLHSWDFARIHNSVQK